MIISSFKPLLGGAEHQALLLATHLVQARGCDVTILTRWIPGTPRLEEHQGVTIIRVGMHRSVFYWKVWSCLCMLFTVFKWRCHIDVLHAHQPDIPAFVAGLMGLVLGKPALCKLPGTKSVHQLTGWRGALLKRLIDRFIAVNSENRAEILTYIDDEEKICLIPNGVILSDNHPLNGKSEYFINLLFVGRLEPVKLPELLIEALPQVQAHFPQVRVKYVGDGTLLSKLTTMVQHRNLENAVEFVGRVDSDVMPEIYGRADVFINTSLAEGISNAMLEAISFDLPVVCSHIAGNRDVITDDTGWLYEAGNVDELADAIQDVLSNPKATQMRVRHAKKRITEKFDIGVVVDQYYFLYQLLLEK